MIQNNQGPSNMNASINSGGVNQITGTYNCNNIHTNNLTLSFANHDGNSHDVHHGSANLRANQGFFAHQLPGPIPYTNLQTGTATQGPSINSSEVAAMAANQPLQIINLHNLQNNTVAATLVNNATIDNNSNNGISTFNNNLGGPTINLSQEEQKYLKDCGASIKFRQPGYIVEHHKSTQTCHEDIVVETGNQSDCDKETSKNKQNKQNKQQANQNEEDIKKELTNHLLALQAECREEEIASQRQLKIENDTNERDEEEEEMDIEDDEDGDGEDEEIEDDDEEVETEYGQSESELKIHEDDQESKENLDESGIGQGTR